MNNSARGADAANATTLSNISGPGPGHNAWLMTSALLVLFMTLPGLALFYGGLVRQKNVLSILAQCLGIAGLVSILWWAIGYSLVFAHGCAFFGGTQFAFLRGVTAVPNTDYSYWVSHNVFAMYQLMFAIITPALIIGSVAERMKFSAVMVIVGLWMFLVYFPLAHMVWGIDGLMNGVWNPNARIRAIDFAGGTVVHMSSGWSALLLCLFLGPRLGFRKEIMAPHSMVLCMVGTGMLWVGWYGFNAGSALGADGIAANAFMTTTLATAVASSSWAGLEWLLRGKPSVLGFCSGAVGGLVVITPACGFVDANGAVIIGVLAGAVPFFACTKLKSWFHYDDALDTFRCTRGWRDLGRISHRPAGDCGGKSKSFRHPRSAKRARTNCRAHALAGATESDWNYHRAGVGRDVADWFDCARDDRIADHTGNRASGSRYQPARRRGLYCFWVSSTTITCAKHDRVRCDGSRSMSKIPSHWFPAMTRKDTAAFASNCARDLYEN